MTTTEPTTAETIVIFPAVTCPADMPRRCAGLAEWLETFREDIGEPLKEARRLTMQYESLLDDDRFNFDDEAVYEPLRQVTGYGPLRDVLLSLVEEITYALDGDSAVVPAWADEEANK